MWYTIILGCECSNYDKHLGIKTFSNEKGLFRKLVLARKMRY